MHIMAMNSAAQISRSAFSLIELLIVIAIIAVLAALLLPTITMIRETAMRTKCASSQRQIFMALDAFADDNHDELLNCSGKNGWRWFRDMMPYFIGDCAVGWSNRDNIITEYKSVSPCPKFKGRHGVHDMGDLGVYQWDSRGFAMNALPLAPDDWRYTIHDWWFWNGTGVGPTTVRRSQITYPSSRLLVGDSDDWLFCGPGWWDDFKLTYQSNNFWDILQYRQADGSGVSRHRGKLVGVFYDGHVGIHDWHVGTPVAGNRDVRLALSNPASFSP
jgi:prepilin-type N-terminal cleavage/methylation domain-containing protein